MLLPLSVPQSAIQHVSVFVPYNRTPPHLNVTVTPTGMLAHTVSSFRNVENDPVFATIVLTISGLLSPFPIAPFALFPLIEKPATEMLIYI